jgi:hypothetical protein
MMVGNHQADGPACPIKSQLLLLNDSQGDYLRLALPARSVHLVLWILNL